MAEKPARSRKSCNPQEHSKTGGQEVELGAEKIIAQEGVAKALVAASDAGKRRAGSETRRLQTNQPEEDRGIAQALG